MNEVEEIKPEKIVDQERGTIEELKETIEDVESRPTVRGYKELPEEVKEASKTLRKYYKYRHAGKLFAPTSDTVQTNVRIPIGLAKEMDVLIREKGLFSSRSDLVKESIRRMLHAF